MTDNDPPVVAELTVREASEHDAGVVAELNDIVQRLHYEAHPDRFLPPDATRVEPTFRDWLGAGGQRVWLPGTSQTRGWICEDGQGTAVGYIVAVYRERAESPFTMASRWVELDQIAVRDDAQGSGAGTALANAVMTWAKELGIPTVELTVWEFNKRAQSFFASIGCNRLQQRLSVGVPETSGTIS